MNIANIYRDRTLDMLSEENVGETVRVDGTLLPPSEKGRHADLLQGSAFG